MNIYNPTLKTWDSRPIVTGTLTARYFSTPGYNTARKTIMYVGGYNYGFSPTHFDPVVVITEYTPTTNTWSVMVKKYNVLCSRARFFAKGKDRYLFGRRENSVLKEVQLTCVNLFCALCEPTPLFFRSSLIGDNCSLLQEHLPVQEQTIAQRSVSASG
jgi:hypothetical protein